MEFGFTNSDEKFNEVSKFRKDAIADGWEAHAMSDSEPLESWAKLTRDGFVMHVLARSEATGKKPGKWKYEAEVTIWGPDELQIKPQKVHDFEAIKAGLRRCPVCGKGDVETQRFSFAGRCCAECRPKMAEKHERPGWTN